MTEMERTMLEALKEAVELIRPKVAAVGQFELEWTTEARGWLVGAMSIISRAEKALR